MTARAHGIRALTGASDRVYFRSGIAPDQLLSDGDLRGWNQDADAAESNRIVPTHAGEVFIFDECSDSCRTEGRLRRIGGVDLKVGRYLHEIFPIDLRGTIRRLAIYELGVTMRAMRHIVNELGDDVVFLDRLAMTVRTMLQEYPRRLTEMVFSGRDNLPPRR